MFSLLLFVLLCASCLAKSVDVTYSFSKAVGGGSGSSFATEARGGIRAVRVWEKSSSHITGPSVVRVRALGVVHVPGEHVVVHVDGYVPPYSSQAVMAERLRYAINSLTLKNISHWSPLVGKKVGTALEIELLYGETITQISGKYHSNYIYQVIFGTSRGRLLLAGQPTTVSFNFYPRHPKAELKMLSGSFNGHGITSLAAHWGAIYSKHTGSKK